jgi:hypothetical protein
LEKRERVDTKYEECYGRTEKNEKRFVIRRLTLVEMSTDDDRKIISILKYL